MAAKRSTPSAAKDLYTSAWFKKARSYVEARQGRWFILSAEHGLLDPEAVVAPYEKTLNKMGVADRRQWAKRVEEQLRQRVGKCNRIVVLAGARYRENLMPILNELAAEVTVPMEGLRIGEQLRWLTENTGDYTT